MGMGGSVSVHVTSWCECSAVCSMSPRGKRNKSTICIISYNCMSVYYISKFKM